ncbi:MAG: hypothetical protein AAFX76_08175 [Planctomycetota bacterium]
MSSPPLSQIDTDQPDISDSQKGTRGGPPGWLALAIVAGLFLVVAAVLLVGLMAG